MLALEARGWYPSPLLELLDVTLVFSDPSCRRVESGLMFSQDVRHSLVEALHSGMQTLCEVVRSLLLFLPEADAILGYLVDLLAKVSDLCMGVS